MTFKNPDRVLSLETALRTEVAADDNVNLGTFKAAYDVEVGGRQDCSGRSEILVQATFSGNTPDSCVVVAIFYREVRDGDGDPDSANGDDDFLAMSYAITITSTARTDGTRFYGPLTRIPCEGFDAFRLFVTGRVGTNVTLFVGTGV